MVHLFFRAVISSANQIMEEEFYYQNIGTNTLFQYQVKVLY